MKLNDIISMVKDTTQKIGEKKTLKIKDIVLIPQKLLVMEEDVLEKMKKSMQEEGFKLEHEIHIWKRGKEYILIDGHTRKTAWESLGNKTIPCIVHNFANMEEAKTFAIKEQINRRNLSGQALLDAVANFNFEKGKGHMSGEKGKASEIIAKQIGVSSKTVEKNKSRFEGSHPRAVRSHQKRRIEHESGFQSDSGEEAKDRKAEGIHRPNVRTKGRTNRRGRKARRKGSFLDGRGLC